MSRAGPRAASKEGRARPQVEVVFPGSRRAAAFLTQALARPEIRRGDLELAGASRRFLLRLSVASWQPAPGETAEGSLAAHLIRLAKDAGGTVRPLPPGLDVAAGEIADLAEELRAIQAEVERLTRESRVAAAQDEMGWEEPEWMNDALRLERGLTAAAEPLGRLVAIFAELSREG